MTVTVALAFLALSACGWVIYRLGAVWFGRAAGALAALHLPHARARPLLRRARLVDVPYLLLVLSALLVESRHRRAHAARRRARARAARPRRAAAARGVGLLGLYWLYLLDLMPAFVRARLRRAGARQRSAAPIAWQPRTRRQLARLTLLAAAAPLIWLLSDLLITGNPLWSLTHTRHTASLLDRVTGIAERARVHPPAHRRNPAPAGARSAPRSAACSRCCGCARRALLGAGAGVLAVVVFAAFATVGLPINTRYAFLASAILCRLLRRRRRSAGLRLTRGDPRRRWWMAGGAVVLVALLAYAPAQYRSAHRNWTNSRARTASKTSSSRSSRSHAINLRCGPVGVPNHAPVPLLALYLKTSPAQHRQPRSRPHRLRRLRRPRQQGSRRRLRARPARPHRARQRAARVHRVRRQPLMADLHALPGRRLALRVDRAPLVETRGSRRLIAAHGSGPGTPAAPAGDRLRLLPSGPDLVRKPTPRGTRTIDAPSDGATGAGTPRRGIRPR